MDGYYYIDFDGQLHDAFGCKGRSDGGGGGGGSGAGAWVVGEEGKVGVMGDGW
jgi:hypothetical protein